MMRRGAAAGCGERVGATSAASDVDRRRRPVVGHIAGFRRRVAECNEITSEAIASYVPLVVAGVPVGLMQAFFADALVTHGEGVFVRQTQTTDDGVGIVALDPEREMTAEERSMAVAPVMAALRDAGVVTGWRDELFPVAAGYGDEPLMTVERAAASLLGIRAYGVHVNGYVTLPTGEVELWVAKRSATKQTYPGKLDHLVAGGLPAGIPPGECVVKECGEEASIPPDLAAAARPVGIVSYAANYQGCCKRDVLFCYDLELPVDFVPVPDDGEVESFERVPIEEVMRVISETTAFKTNCCLVIVDFLVRHGFVGPEEPGYMELVASLRAGEGW